jgi:hypothetical protein
MKKVLLAVVALAAGALVFSKVRSSKRNQDDLWQDATSS